MLYTHKVAGSNPAGNRTFVVVFAPFHFNIYGVSFVMLDFNRPANNHVPRGLTARISGFHPGGPGSTPGVGRFIFNNNFTPVKLICNNNKVRK